MTNLDLTTTFVNTSGKAKRCAYFGGGPPLEVGEERTCLGNLFSAVTGSSLTPTPRYIKALQKDLAEGKVEDGEARFIPAIYSDQ